MAAGPVPGHTPFSDPAHGHTRLARSSVTLAEIVAGVVGVSYAIFGVAYAVGGDDAISDNWVGYLGGVALVGGLAASLVAFVMAMVSKSRHEQWRLLWLPLSLFPALLAVVVLAEVFWME